nr:pentatricopeptide repeat-containing protein At4g02750-like [Ipomoea batatas]
MNGFLCRLNRSLSTLTSHYPNYLFQCNNQIQHFFRLGQVGDARRLFDGMPQRDSVTWNSMISGYCDNGRVDDARSLFDAFQGKNVRTWTSMLSGYARAGRIYEAVFIFDAMPERNIVSYNAMLSGYLQNGEVESARKLFDGMSDRNIASWNCMITGYCRMCWMREARQVFDVMPERNEVSYMVMISGYAEVSEYEEAWRLVLDMHRRGEVRPDQQIFLAVMSVISGLDDDVELLTYFLPLPLKMGYSNDVVVGTAILNTFKRIGSLDLAFKFFNDMPEKNDYTWSTMISAFSHYGRLEDAILLYRQCPQKNVGTQTAMMTAYAQNGMMVEARRIFDTIRNPPNVLTWNALLAGYIQNGMVEEAREFFLQMPARDMASWGTMVSGLVQNGDNQEALEVIGEMHRLGIIPNHSSLTSALSACANIGNIEMGKQIHSLTIKSGCQFNSFIGNGLINMYAKCKNTEDFSRAFDIMKVRDTVSWNSLITGLSENCRLSDAVEVFQRMPNHNVVSWTALISAYVQAEQGEVAFRLFLEMLNNGIKPSEPTVTSLLSASGSLGATKLGEEIHALAYKLGLNLRLFVGNALITMYFKCGSHDGFQVFEDMYERDVITWNATLTGCAQNGLGREAIHIFEKMKREFEVVPNQITFLQLLSACSHSGLVDEGLKYFDSMSRDYGIRASINHYTAMVDLLGRAGRLSEAESLVKNMPMKPDTVILDALLAACKKHSNMNLGRRVAERLFQMGAKESGAYVLLSNIYASQGMWEKVQKVRRALLNREVNKEPGFSWIHIKGNLHSFLTGSRMVEQVGEISSMLEELYMQFKSTGYVPDTNFVMHDVDEEQKQIELLYHSEKIAVVFGILKTPHGSPIQIMKNLRTCGDCHNFMKFVSKFTQRKIIIRDGNRFHHFQDGLCSCGDYW